MGPCDPVRARTLIYSALMGAIVFGDMELVFGNVLYESRFSP
jgi:hypothetical protein